MVVGHLLINDDTIAVKQYRFLLIGVIQQYTLDNWHDSLAGNYFIVVWMNMGEGKKLQILELKLWILFPSDPNYYGETMERNLWER